MWWLLIALVAIPAFEVLDEDRRAAWVKWVKRRRFDGSVPVLSHEEWYVRLGDQRVMRRAGLDIAGAEAEDWETES